jgi:hypothetical protein
LLVVRRVDVGELNIVAPLLLATALISAAWMTPQGLADASKSMASLRVAWSVLAIVALAVTLDRLSQAMARKGHAAPLSGRWVARHPYLVAAVALIMGAGIAGRRIGRHILARRVRGHILARMTRIQQQYDFLTSA